MHVVHIGPIPERRRLPAVRCALHELLRYPDELPVLRRQLRLDRQRVLQRQLHVLSGKLVRDLRHLLVELLPERHRLLAVQREVHGLCRLRHELPSLHLGLQQDRQHLLQQQLHLLRRGDAGRLHGVRLRLLPQRLGRLPAVQLQMHDLHGNGHELLVLR